MAKKVKRAKRKAQRKRAVSVSRPIRTVSRPAAAAPAGEYKPAYASLEHMKPSKSKYIVIGTWALILAVILSVMLALVETPYLVVVLVAAGFLIGFLNFEHEETVKFLVSTVSMLIIATALLLTGFSRLGIVAPVVALFLERAAYNVIAVVAPAAFVLSLKALRELAQ